MSDSHDTPTTTRGRYDIAWRPSARPPTGADVVGGVLAQFARNFLLNDVDSAGSTLLERARTQTNDYSIAGHVPRRRDSQVERVHQARVGIRRLRSTIRTFEALLDPHWVASVLPDLSWYAGVLGDSRDLDVLRASLVAAVWVVDDPGARELVLVRLDEELLIARRRRDECRATPRYHNLVHDVARCATNVQFAPVAYDEARVVLSGQLNQAWSDVRGARRRARRDPSEHKLHKLRITLKRLQYSCEAVGVTGDDVAIKVARCAQTLQTKLGSAHDAAVAIEWLLARQGDGRLVGDLTGLESYLSRVRDEYRRGWRRDLDDLERRWRAWRSED